MTNKSVFKLSFFIKLFLLISVGLMIFVNVFVEPTVLTTEERAAMTKTLNKKLGAPLLSNREIHKKEIETICYSNFGASGLFNGEIDRCKERMKNSYKVKNHSYDKRIDISVEYWCSDWESIGYKSKNNCVILQKRKLKQ